MDGSYPDAMAEILKSVYPDDLSDLRDGARQGSSCPLATKTKDWYDIAYVLLRNDAGGPLRAAARVRTRFAADLAGTRTSLDDLLDNFADPSPQGAQSYADSFHFNHPEQDHHELAVTAAAAISQHFA